jgi:hypothetical protein
MKTITDCIITKFVSPFFYVRTRILINSKDCTSLDCRNRKSYVRLDFYRSGAGNISEQLYLLTWT